MIPVERKCMFCKGKYYSPAQDQLHYSCKPPYAEISLDGGVTKVESHPCTEIPNISEIEVIPKNPFDVPTFTDIVAKPIPEVDGSEKKIKKIKNGSIESRAAQAAKKVAYRARVKAAGG